MSQKKVIIEKLKKLDQDTVKIYESLDGVADEKMNDPSYGWSIIQVMSHLNDAESASLKYMEKKLNAGDKMGNAGGLNSLRMWVTNQALRSSLKWKAPSYIANPPVYSSDEMKNKWAETRKSIMQFVESYPDKWLNKLVYKHPMAGRQNLESAVDSFIYHQLHHVHQIDRIRKQLKV